MQDSPLELLFYYVESLRWKVEEDFDPENTASLQAADLDWHLQRNDDENGEPRQGAYRLRLELEPQESKFPYSFEIVLIGFFRLHDMVPEEQIARVLDANAPAVLYGAAREALATSIGRGPFRPMLLPAVHFLDLEREVDEAEENKSVKPQPSKPVKAARKTKVPRSKSQPRSASG